MLTYISDFTKRG